RLPIGRRFAGHVQVAADLRPTGVAEPRPGRSGPACLVSPAGARSIGLPGAVRLVALEPGHAPAVPVHLRLRRERLDLLRDGLVEGEGFTGDDTEQAAHGAGPAFVEDGTGTGRAVGAGPTDPAGRARRSARCGAGLHPRVEGERDAGEHEVDDDV